MRKSICIIFFFGIVRCYSQIYYPLLKNTTWYMYINSFGNIYNYWYYSLNDTAVNTITYKKYLDSSSSGNYTLLREDTIQKKVWRMDNIQSTETLLYDFSLGIGGKLPVYIGSPNAYDTLTVMQIDSVLTNSGYRKRFLMYSSNANLNLNIIESVGSINEPIRIDYYASDPVYYLICNHQNMQLIYSKPNSTCLSFTGIEEIDFSNFISLSPSPATNNLQLDVGNWQGEKIVAEVFNVVGEKVTNKQLSVNDKSEIDISLLEKGVYYLKVSCEGKSAVKKFVKM